MLMGFVREIKEDHVAAQEPQGDEGSGSRVKDRAKRSGGQRDEGRGNEKQCRAPRAD